MKYGIKKLLLIGIILLAVVPLVTNLISLKFQSEIDRNQKILETESKNKELINNFNLTLANNTLGYMDAIVDKDSFKVVDEIKKKHVETKEFYLKNKPELLEIVKQNTEGNKFEDLNKNFETYWEKGDGLIKTIEDKNLEKISEFDDTIDELNGKMQEFGFSLIAKMNNVVDRASHDLDKAENLSILISRLSTLISIVFATALGFLMFKKISSELNHVNSEIEKSTQSLSLVSDEFKVLGHDLSRSMEYQVQSLHQTVAALEEINATVARNAESAKSSEEYADECVAAANGGRDTVRNMTTTMVRVDNDQRKIIEILNQTNEDVLNLVGVINNVNEKTRVINDIVFQTKLLSFNASVEAARAGEMGKGFAVVAEEVGNLASMSGNAAKEINDILQSSTGKVEQVVKNMKENVETIKKSSEENLKDIGHSKTECENKLHEIMSKVSDLKMMSTNIAIASKEQSLGVHEISISVHEIDKTTTKNTELAKACEEKSKSLSLSAEKMQETLAHLNKAINS